MGAAWLDGPRLGFACVLYPISHMSIAMYRWPFALGGSLTWIWVAPLAGCEDEPRPAREQPADAATTLPPPQQDAGPADAGHYSCTPPSSCPDLDITGNMSKACC